LPSDAHFIVGRQQLNALTVLYYNAASVNFAGLQATNFNESQKGKMGQMAGV
jgi:hypothetical protein